jgi:hypothetical protein
LISNQYPFGTEVPTYRQFRNFLQTNIPEFSSVQLRAYENFLYEHLHVGSFKPEPLQL